MTVAVKSIQEFMRPVEWSTRARHDTDEPRKSTANGFGALLGLVGATSAPRNTATGNAGAGPISGGRADRMRELKRFDVENRRPDSGRIAGAQPPSDGGQRDQSVAFEPTESTARTGPPADGAIGKRPTEPVKPPSVQPGPEHCESGQSDTEESRAPARDATKDAVSHNDPHAKPAAEFDESPRGSPTDTRGPKAWPAPVATAVPDASGAMTGRQNAVEPVSPSPVKSPDNVSGVQRGRDETKSTETATPKRAVKQSDKQEPGASQQAAFERIVKMVRSARNGRETVAHIELNPPSLGPVHVRLQMRDDRLRVRLAAASIEGRSALMNRADELRATLEQQGVRVQRIDFPHPLGDEATPLNGGTGGAADHSATRHDARASNAESHGSETNSPSQSGGAAETGDASHVDQAEMNRGTTRGLLDIRV